MLRWSMVSSARSTYSPSWIHFTSFHGTAALKVMLSVMPLGGALLLGSGLCGSCLLDGSGVMGTWAMAWSYRHRRIGWNKSSNNWT